MEFIGYPSNLSKIITYHMLTLKQLPVEVTDKYGTFFSEKDPGR